MPRSLVLRVVTAIVLVGLGVGGYLLWIPLHRPDTHKVAALASTSPVTGLRAHPKAAAVDPATATPISAVKAAASATPGETAGFSVSWKGISPVTAGTVELITVPTVQAARSAHQEVVKVELSQTSLTDTGYGFGGRTRVAGVPGAKGAFYVKGTTPTITASTPRVTEVIFRVSRVLVDVSVAAKGTGATTTARALALAEYRHLERVGADPVLAQTVLPLVATIVYVLVALAVLAAAEVTPWFVTAAQQRRHEAHVAAQRRARVSRGNKVVKRHASRGYAARVESGGRTRHR